MLSLNKKKGALNLVFFVFFTIFSIIICVKNAEALAVYEFRNEPIYFEPGLEVERYFEVGLTSNDVSIDLDGPFEEYATLDRYFIKGDDPDRGVNVKIKFPGYEDAKPGHHNLYFNAREVSSSGGMIGGNVVILTKMAIHVYFSDKHLELSSFEVENVNVNDTVKFKVTFSNFGKKNISKVQAIFYVYDLAGNMITYAQSESTELRFLDVRWLTANSSTVGWLPGTYNSTAIIMWDGRENYAETTFRVGYYYVELVNNTDVVEAGKISPFFIDVRSRWNGVMKNVYGIITSEDKSFKTPSFDLAPWEEKRLETYFDAIEFENGTYNINIKLFYEDTFNEKNTTLNVVLPQKEETDAEEEIPKAFGPVSPATTIILIAVIVLIIIADIVWMRLHIKKRKQ